MSVIKQGFHLIIIERTDEMNKLMKDNGLNLPKYLFVPLKYRDRNTYLNGTMQQLLSKTANVKQLAVLGPMIGSED